MQCGRGGAGGCSDGGSGAAPIGLYTKLRKTRTFQMDVMHKVHIEKLSNPVHIIYVWLFVPISLNES